MKYLFVIGLLLFASPLYSADIIDSEKIGIPAIILRGRTIVDSYRKQKDNPTFSYDGKTHGKNVDRDSVQLAKMQKKLQSLGFKDLNDLIKQSTDADSKIGINEKEWWK